MPLLPQKKSSLFTRTSPQWQRYYIPNNRIQNQEGIAIFITNNTNFKPIQSKGRKKGTVY
jgi:hypothetical protein